jgi:hypothetical protein
MTEQHYQEYYPHMFWTSAGLDRFKAIVTKACKGHYWIDLDGVDRRFVPVTRLYAVKFTSIEDRDRVRIAMRFVDQDQPDAPAPRAPKFARA